MSTVDNQTAVKRARGCNGAYKVRGDFGFAPTETEWRRREFCKLEMAGSILVWSIEKTKEIKEMKRKRKVRKQKRELRL